MKKFLKTKLHRAKILLPIVLLSVVFAGSAYFFSLKPGVKNVSVKPVSVNSGQTKTITPSPTISPTTGGVLGANISKSLLTPTVILENQTNNIALSQNNSANSYQSSIPTPAPTQQISSPTTPPTTAPQSTPTQTPIPTEQPAATPTTTTQTVSVQIQAPDGISNFPVTLKDGANVCDVLQTAKNEGKINSLTLDDTYLSAFNSKYVLEINGYKDNWTFKINGNSPLGCSLSNPKPNDIIVWKFG